MVEIDKKKKERSLPTSINMNKVKFLFASKFRFTPQFIINALKKITSTFQTIQPLMKELNSLVREKVYNYLNSFSFSYLHTVVIKILETL